MIAVLIRDVTQSHLPFGAQTGFLTEAAIHCSQELTAQDPIFCVLTPEALSQGLRSAVGEGSASVFGWIWKEGVWQKASCQIQLVMDRFFSKDGVPTSQFEESQVLAARAGIPWANPSSFMELSFDKWKSHEFFCAHRIPTPSSVLLSKAESKEVVELEKATQGWSVGLLKPRFGGKGRDIWYWKRVGERISIFPTFEALDTFHSAKVWWEANGDRDWIAQEYVPSIKNRGAKADREDQNHPQEMRLWLQKQPGEVWKLSAMAGRSLPQKMNGGDCFVEIRNLASGGKYVPLLGTGWEELEKSVFEEGVRLWRPKRSVINKQDESKGQLFEEHLHPVLEGQILGEPKQILDLALRWVQGVKRHLSEKDEGLVFECALDLIIRDQVWMILEMNSKPGRSIHKMKHNWTEKDRGNHFSKWIDKSRKELVFAPFRYLSSLLDPQGELPYI